MQNDSKWLTLPQPIPGSVNARLFGRFFLPDGRLRSSTAVALFFFLTGDVAMVLGLPGQTVLVTWLFLRRRMTETLTQSAEGSAWRAAAGGLGFDPT